MLGLMPCWGVEWQWRDRRTPKGCVCCRTIGETSSALHGPVICPPVSPWGPMKCWAAGKQHTRTDRPSGTPTPQQHIPPSQLFLTHAHMNICTYKQENFLDGFYSTNPQFFLFSYKLTQLYFWKWNQNPLICHQLSVCLHSVVAVSPKTL